MQLNIRPNSPQCRCVTRFVAFFSVAFVAYFMRTRFGYRSLPEAIHARYGGARGERAARRAGGLAGGSQLRRGGRGCQGVQV